MRLLRTSPRRCAPWRPESLVILARQASLVDSDARPVGPQGEERKRTWLRRAKVAPRLQWCWAHLKRDFQGANVTGAALDPLTHRCHILETKGESDRLQDATRRHRQTG